ncbi:MAG: Nudix family hydrolase [Gammaproteobacteria bacterium]|nr:Nudix family hydrolase [Gammaproteobacteria bacterium]MBU1602448.1 Nudix family hydrolase [Gammaproteobacteria bacterium]MBU2433253.1 Nudix family hydrolase [Gammaproteobacteria bacterium]MBU2451169.1 Nudix family hydrolase [Gammaproteobacteria bacterium]
MTKIVEVAAAVMLRADGTEFLLAQRPEGKVYAGYWEFPGGKVEPGESVREALIRELQEELGITVTACSPWLTRQFTYPHATVRLNFWRVTAWDGEIGITAPLEHAAVDWQKTGKPATVAPILPANDPILKALSLPTTMAITNAEAVGTERQLERLEEALQAGLRLIQVRDKGWPPAQRLWFAAAVCRLAHSHGALVVINDDEDIARQVGADGIHLSSDKLAACTQRPDFAWVGAACHTAAEIARAGELGFDYALLSPVLPTPSHPDAPGLGWPEFARRLAGNTLPVLALGGMKPELLAEAESHGAHGIALMRGW